jgi:hypothetical protein
VLAVSNAWQMLPDATWLYSNDYAWWQHYRADQFTGAKYTASRRAAREFNLMWAGQCITGVDDGWPSREFGKICNAGNSGAQAINLAYLFGAKRIILIGFDYKVSPEKAHFFGNHPEHMKNAHGVNIWMDRLKPLVVGLKQYGCELINCTIDSAIPNELIKRQSLMSLL